MNYELAKELKDAGFPQITTPEPTFDFPTSVYVPTLEELIESCGDSVLMWEEKGSWRAVKYLVIANTCAPFYEWAVEDEFNELGLQKTPSEAVAKLWLCLNQKKGSQK
jgi:hypothetical protein